MSNYTDFYVGLFTKMQEVEQQNKIAGHLRGKPVEVEDDAEALQRAQAEFNAVPSYVSRDKSKESGFAREQ